jgi:hypothetical protein
VSQARYRMAMCFKEFVDYIIPIIGLIVSIVACVYTCLTYRKSRDILEVVDEERKYRWNQKELETLFSTIPIDSIESFFEVPDIIRNELWEGLRAVDLRTFQYNGKERELIVKFVNGLDSFCNMHYKQVTSGNWKFEPLAEKEPFNAEKERQKMEELYAKARTLRPLFNEVKEILMKYHVNLRDINKRAYDFYFKMQKEEQEQFNE